MTATDNLGNITLYNADNIEVMKQFSDKQFDLAIVDPPYGINATKMQMGSNPNRKGKGEYPSVSTAVKVKGRLNSGGGKLKGRLLNNSDCSWDSEPPTPEYFEHLFRVSKNQIIWGGNYFDLPPTRCIICWDKMQPWENFSQWEMAWTSFDKPAALFRYSNTGGGNKEKKIHPTQKPIALYAWLLQKFAGSNDTILDTGFGSLSIGVACSKTGHSLTAIERHRQIYLDGVERLKNNLLQQTLF